MEIGQRMNSALRLTCRLASAAALLIGLSAGAARAGEPDKYQNDAFEAAQWAMLSSAGKALEQLGLRAASGSPELAALVRQRQDLVALRRQTEEVLSASGDATSANSQSNVIALRGQIDSITTEIAGIDRRLAKEFPRYTDLANPAPLAISEVQGLLDEDEALLLYLCGKHNVFIWAVSKHDSAWTRTDYGAKTLGGDIATLRSGLDPNAVARGAVSLAEDNTKPLGPHFDRTLALALYNDLVLPVMPVLKGKNLVFVVPDGPLASLPLSVLVTKPPTGDDTDPQAMRETDWLIREFALTTLPSVDSLRVIGNYPAPQSLDARIAFRGFGAPVLGGQKAPVLVASNDETSFFRGMLADVEAVRDLPSLPQTRHELLEMASLLGAGEGDLYLGPLATETAVKTTDLSTTDVIAFATHGLLSGDMKGLAEPAIVMTPPDVATRQDDGLLTASEVAELTLSANWVILSACNTAAGDGRPDAEGLSGLARAFLYAGARAILVSHWPVRDDAAARLTTAAIAAMKQEPTMRRSEALRGAALDLMQDGVDATLAFPSAWAPFVIVGEGGH